MASRIAFGPFLLDRAAGRIWRDGQPIDLRPKAWAVLCHLIDRPGDLVTPRELLDRVWGDVSVTPQSLTNVIAQIRAALGDDRLRPRILQTVHGRGYRFIAPVAADLQAVEPPMALGTPVEMVGRDAELGVLRTAWRRACQGIRQLAFITGEVGIGKTTLAEAFLHDATRLGDPSPLIARGHCTEHHGRYQPYLPLLAALDELAAGPHGRRLRDILHRYGPTWLVQIPGLLTPARRARIEQSVLGTTASRMLYEGTRVLEALTRTVPVLLLLEDLHWSDGATIDLVGLLARRKTPVRVLVLATYRSPEGVGDICEAAELADRLARDALAQRLVLSPLDGAAIEAYLAARLDDPARAAVLAPLVEARSAGNPLFMRSLVDQLLEERADGPVGERPALPTPRSLETVVWRRLAKLDTLHRDILEAASIWADPFRPVDIAEIVGRAAELVEAACDALCRIPRMLRRDGPESDGRYAFIHTAYRHAVYEAIPAPRRRELHRRVGEALRGRTGPDAPAAAVLANHFRCAGDVEQAVQWLRTAADVALARFAPREAVECFEAAAKLLESVPVDPSRTAAAAQVQIQLGGALCILHGFAAPEARQAFRRAGELLDQQPSLVEQVGVDLSLALCDITAARWLSARTHTDRLLAVSKVVPPLEPVACCWAAYVESGTGNLERARALLERGAAGQPYPGVPMDLDVRRMIDSQLALVLTELGCLATARIRRRAALARSQRSGTQLDLAHAALWAVEAAVFADDRRAGPRLAAFGIEVSRRNAFARYLVQCRLYAAWFDPTLSPSERVRHMENALEERRTLGDRWQESVALGLIAAAQHSAGRLDDALTTLARALDFVETTGERHFLAELLRLRAACLATARRWDEADESLLEAIRIASGQRAALWTSRARAALVELRRARRARRLG